MSQFFSFGDFVFACVHVSYLVYVVGINACVKTHVEVVEHLHYLQRGAGGRDRGETNDVWEKNSHLEQNGEKLFHHS